jgi:hypothetical protein
MGEASELSIDPDLIDEIVGKKGRPRKAAKDPSHFIGCPVWWLRHVLPVVRSKYQLAVALYLWRRRIVCGNHKTFDVPNNELKSWGVSRKVKYQTLDRLAVAGVIKVSRKGRGAPTVTILSKESKRKKA